MSINSIFEQKLSYEQKRLRIAYNYTEIIFTKAKVE